MLLPAHHLQSPDVFSYTYISLFMLTYPKSDTIHLNGDIREHLSSLNAFLDRPTPHRKTLLKLRHDLVRAFQQRFFLDNDDSQHDSFTLLSLFSTFPALFGFSFPVPFLEDLSKAQEAISVSLLTTDFSIKSFFSSLQSHQHTFLTSDIIFLIIKLLEYLEEHHLSAWHDVLSTLKLTLLDHLFADIYSFSIVFSQGSHVQTSRPSIIESHLQDLFKTPTGTIRQPSEAFKHLIIDTIDLLIQDDDFRKSTQKVILEKKSVSQTTPSTSKISA